MIIVRTSIGGGKSDEEPGVLIDNGEWLIDNGEWEAVGVCKMETPRSRLDLKDQAHGLKPRWG